jgi:hypothetical protein
VELLEVLGDELDHDMVANGELTPMFFGSAMTNFGVDIFLQSFIEYADKPGGWRVGVVEVEAEWWPGLMRQWANVHCCGCEHSNAVSCIMAVSSCHGWHTVGFYNQA